MRRICRACLIAAVLVATTLMTGGTPAAAGTTTTGTTTTGTTTTAGTASARRVVIGRLLLGYSRDHRRIVAYHLGNPHARRTVLLLGQMHGDEHAGVRIARSIVHGRRAIAGINLWVIPTMNPDGNAANTRGNAHGVDLNRNWPTHWVHLTGRYNSGPRPLSEPETRAVWRFITRHRPRYVISLHQPLDGVDEFAGHGRAYRRFRDQLSRRLHLPIKDFECWSTCHGALSVWYEAHRIGVAVETVEFGWRPTRGYLLGTARPGIIAAVGGHFTAAQVREASDATPQ